MEKTAAVDKAVAPVKAAVEKATAPATNVAANEKPAPVPPPPPAQHSYGGYSYYGPGWGHRGNKHYRKQGFGRLFFSS